MQALSSKSSLQIAGSRAFASSHGSIVLAHVPSSCCRIEQVLDRRNREVEASEAAAFQVVVFAHENRTVGAAAVDSWVGC